MTRLSVPYRRAAERVCMALEHGGRGLYVAIGTSDAVQAAVEAKVEERFPVARLTYTGEELRPVGRIEEAAQYARCVSVRLRAPAEHVWRNLDVGREHLRAVHAVMVVWVDLGELQRFSDHAPNLWAVHASTLWCLSREDWPTVAASDPETSSVHWQGLGRGQGSPWSSFARQVWASARGDLEEAHRLLQAGDAERALERLPPRWSMGAADRETWRRLRFALLVEVGRYSDAALLVPGKGGDFPGEGDLLLGVLARVEWRWPAAHAYLERVRTATEPVWPSELRQVFNEEALLAPACVELATDDVLRLGRLDLGDYLITVVRHLLRHRRAPATSVFGCEARAAVERFDGEFALRLLHALVGSDRMERPGSAASNLATIYADLGLDDDAAHFRALAEAAPHPPAPSPEVTERIRQARLAVSPYARLEDAVEQLEKALTDDDRAAAHRQLEAAERHWADEDPAYRSLRLRDRWQRAAAQLAEREGREGDAIAILRTLCDELASLPRTQCHARLTLAHLLVRSDQGREAHEIAEAIRLKARSALSVGLERLAVDAQLAAARALGDPAALARAERLEGELAP